MANQTVTTVVNYDSAAISGLLNGETITINGGSVTIDADVRWNQQAAVFGSITLSSTLGGSLLIDGTQVWEVPFSASSGNVPTQNALGSNGVTGGTSGATGELTRVWAAGSLDPATAGVAMPATGFIKLRSKTGTFQSGETITLPGGATVTASSAGKRSWIHAVGAESTAVTIPRLGNFSIDGDWYDIGLTDGTDNQQLQFPVQDECPAVQVETAAGSGVYEWWAHGAMRWINNACPDGQAVSGTTATLDNISGPPGALPGGQYSSGTRLRETATTAIHGTAAAYGSNQIAAGILKFRTFIKRETRQWVLVQAHSGTNRYGALVDLNAGTIVANPTAGTPANTSSTISSLGNGWYVVELTLNHALANAGSLGIYLSNSATPTYDSNGIPTYLGVTTEGGYYSETQILHPTLQQISDDARGNYFFSDATTGTLTFAKRDANYNIGLKPPSGCRVRIPNVILSSAALSDWNRNTLNTTLITRYDFAASGGAINISNASCNWYASFFSTPSFVTLENSSFGVQISLNNVSGTTTITNCAVGPSRSMRFVALSVSNCVSGGTITDSRFARHFQEDRAVLFSTSKNFTMTNCRMDSFSNTLGTTARANYFNVSALTTENLVFDNCATVGAGFDMTVANNTTLRNIQYADVCVGTTPVLNIVGITFTTSNNITLDGFSAFGNIANVNPYSAIIATLTFCTNTTVKNIGSPTAPYDCGTISPTGNLVQIASASNDITMRRVYAQNVRAAAISTQNTNARIRAYNVWGDAADSQVMLANDVIAQGCRWTNPGTVQTTVYGTHWEDAFVSTTDGRLMILGNEPIATTTGQCSGSFGVGSGFTSGGSVSLRNITDTVTWTMPYFALGHTGIAKFTSGVFTNPWFVTGTNVQFLEFDYQIDTGTGFSAWKFLLNQGRRAAGGASGTNTVTLTTSERVAMLRQPQIGDYVQSGSNRLPHGTTITNVVGDVLTLSNNFASSMGTNEPVLIWKDIADETISSTDGYKLKVRVKVNTANSGNLFSFLRIPFDTTSVAQQVQYPLPTTQNIGSVINIRAGSRIRVYNVTTATEIANEVVPGTTWSYPYDEGTDFTDGDIINIRLARCSGATAIVGYEATAVAGTTGWELFADQIDDDVYNTNGIDGTTVTEFAFDYPNVQVDINDPDGTTTITRLYAWWSNEQTTVDGIRTLIGGLIAEDTANYKVINSIVDLKLDNAASTGVIFTGDLRLYRADGLAPVVSSTTGGGSITLYAGKVYTTVVSTSSPVITGDISQVPAAVQSGMTAQGYTSARAVNLDRLDATISTRLDSASYTAPPSAATNATAVRTELATELARIDAAVSTRTEAGSTIAANVTQVNGIVIDGVGTEANPWGPV